MRLKNIDKILIMKMEHIGDYILTLPALKIIRKDFPKAKITVVVNSCNKELAKKTPYVDDVIIFDNPLAKRNLRKLDILMELIFHRRKYLHFFKSLNKKNYDMLIDFSNRKYSNFFLKNINSKRKISGLDFNFGKINEGERMIQILKKNNIVGNPKKLKIKISKKEKEKINIEIKKRGISDFIVIHAITPLPEKNWGLEKWGLLCKKLDKNIIFIGSNSDKKTIDAVILKFNLNHKCFNFAGMFDLSQTYELIKKAQLMICSDSGPMHLGELTATPIIALFGDTDEEIWGPRRKKDIIIKNKNIKNIKIDEIIHNIR